ncbi:Por secretion system C-terminal sorting domain-containing protein [Flexibacter flexilis DSM 6793]|uniref:Por secretion system C-terminal sorting domain-containing protein n=1 Tax=Flexibacter flexilis DSM 6793 TaxID=927664 RepID=A0A1I1FWN0_9BACT|nr:T9SS type A sorting domain-containing protein [Flexibacter flexilis]SFC01390.1 Por secretion system C-terminal sorting domain-containing protein [Flexibacter flexilis DSM 6793]
MKKLLFFLAFSLFISDTFAQGVFYNDFDYSFMLQIHRDTISNPNCIWQIGKPNKTIFTEDWHERGLVTDSLNPVPANDTSTFYFGHARNHGGPYGYDLLFDYKLDGDSTDYGKIEVSPDGGAHWVDVLAEDTTYSIYWLYNKPSLKGSTEDWNTFEMNLTAWDMSSNMPISLNTDSILFRFTYITDNGTTPHDGWLIDNIIIYDRLSAVSPRQNNHLISVFPNPVANQLRINSKSNKSQANVQITNIMGEIVYENPFFVGDFIDTRQFPNGLYLLQYSDGDNIATQKFVVSH